MAKKFNRETLIALSKLVRIQCSSEEIESLANNLGPILDYIDQLKEVDKEVDTQGTPPCHHALESTSNVMREDEIGEPLETETFLANAPSRVGRMVRVPPIIKF